MADSFVLSTIACVLRRYWQTRQVTQISFPAAGFSGAVIARVACGAAVPAAHRRRDACTTIVEGPAGVYCLRGWPHEGLPERRIRGLHRLLRHIADQGVDCVSVPVADDAGETLVREHGRHWQLEPWLPGAADYWTDPGEARLRSAMRRLAQWHRAAASFVPRPDEAEWFASCRQAGSPAVRERLRRIEQLLRGGVHYLRAALVPRAGAAGVPPVAVCGAGVPPAEGSRDGRTTSCTSEEFHDIGRRILELFGQAAPAVATRLAAMQHASFRLQPCLRDVWHDHVFFSGDEVTGLIDPSACRRENVATDLARLLGSLVGDDAALWELALEHYQRQCPLTAQELALVQALDQSTVLLAGITWLERDAIAGARVAEDSRVVERMRRIETRLARLALT